MTDRKVMQQALKALEGVYLSLQLPDLLKVVGPITALREALEQPEQEPVAQQYAKLAQHCMMLEHKLAQRPWQGLTDEEVAIASAEFDTKLKLAFHAGMYKAQIILRKKNDSTY